MDEMENLVKLQRSVNVDSDIRLPILETTVSGYYPVTTRDMAIIRQEIIHRAKVALPREKIYIRQKSLYNLVEKADMEKIPNYLYSELFKSHKIKWEVNEVEEKIAKNGFKTFKNVRRFDTDCIDLGELRADIQNLHVTKIIVDNDLIPELVWQNEVGGEDSFTPEMPTFDSITSDFALEEFNRWKKWMLENALDQFHFFQMILKSFCFSNHIKDANRKICVGVGDNKGGKGTLIKMMSCIPNCREPDDFGFEAINKEYRSSEAFKPGSTLSVCHEYQLKEKLEVGAIGLLKSATRGETLGVRKVGSAAIPVKFWGGLVLFSNLTSDRKSALFTTQRYFSEWSAYDRFNIVFFDWFERYPRNNQILDTVEEPLSKRAQAFGLHLWNYANEIKNEIIPFYPIPSAFKAEGACEMVTRYEQWLENILEAWGEFYARLEGLLFEGQYPAIEDQQKLATCHFSPLFKEKSLLAKEFQFVEKTEKGDRIKSVFNTSTCIQCIEKLGGSRKWQVPPKLEEFIDKSCRLNNLNRDRVVLFNGPEYLAKN